MTASHKSPIVCQIENPAIRDELREEDSPTFPEKDIQHKLQMAVADRKKRKANLCAFVVLL